MIKSLYSGVSGMKIHQVRMDVIANNISNVNTTAFKAGRVNFKDILSQNIDGGQVGRGMSVESIDNIFTQGSLSNTGKDTDVYIQGNGFFGVQNTVGGANTTYYTRDGSFSIDAAGNLTNSVGYGVVDTSGAPIVLPVTTPIESVSIDRDGAIYVNGSSTASATIGLIQFPDMENMKKQGENLYSYSGIATPTFAAPGSTGMGTTISNNLEMSNVDLTNEFANMISTQRGYQANARIITTSDEMLQEIMGLKR